MARNNLTASIRQKKADYEREIINKSRTSPKILYSYINNQKKTQPLTCLKTQRGLINDDILISEELSTFFQSVFTPSTASTQAKQDFNDVNFDPFFSVSDVLNCLKALKTNTSPGPDLIHPFLLKNCATSIAKPLYLIFCISLRTGTFPSIWKDAHVTPIHKGGSITSIENYRPICILSSLSKVFEKIISKFLKDYLLDQNFIHHSQHGFVKGKSCLTNLLTAVNDWSSAVDKRQACDIIYLDFKKAFDTVDHSVLITKLQQLNLPNFLIHWFSSYLSNRRFRVSVRGAFSKWAHSTSGVPQGSVLGPLLFNIFINDLPSHLLHSYCLLFADDLKLYRIVSNDSDRIALQSDLDAIALWANKNHMAFNISKSAVLHIGSNNLNYQYYLNSQPIPCKESVRDLGVIVDNKLKFHSQSAVAAKKAISAANYIFKSFSFLNCSLFCSLYKVFVRPHCIQAWQPHFKKSMDILEKTQRKITKWCPGLQQLSYENRLKALDLPTLTNRFKRGDLIETFKLLTNYYNISPDVFFTLSTDNRTRGHSLKLLGCRYFTDTRKFFFSNRVIEPWNNLPNSLVTSSSINIWKAQYSALFPNN